jgi:hypothetical protein
MILMQRKTNSTNFVAIILHFNEPSLQIKRFLFFNEICSTPKLSSVIDHCENKSKAAQSVALSPLLG